MNYISGFQAKEEKERAYDIHYWVIEEGENLYIRAAVEGSLVSDTVLIHTKEIREAEKTAFFLAENAVHPWHLKDILSDLNL